MAQQIKVTELGEDGTQEWMGQSEYINLQGPDGSQILITFDRGGWDVLMVKTGSKNPLGAMAIMPQAANAIRIVDMGSPPDPGPRGRDTGPFDVPPPKGGKPGSLDHLVI